MKKLRIGIIATPWTDIPPTRYAAGIELMISFLTEELVKRGHKVTLFASGDSKTKARLIPFRKKSLFADNIGWSEKYFILLNIANAAQRQEEFDIIHDHNNEWGPCMSVAFTKTPIVYTIHNLAQNGSKGNYAVYEKFKNCNYVSVSDNLRKSFPPDMNFIASIYNGVKVEDYEFGEKPKNYFLWLGRITPKKGTYEAAKIAKETKINLRIAGPPGKGEDDEKYFTEKIKPFFKFPNITYEGDVHGQKKINLLKNAKALIMPTLWNDPCPMVPIEAMASGTPVIGLNNGAMPFIVKNNKTGFIAKNLGEMKKAIFKIDKINRLECRLYVKKYFSVERMVDEYEKVYQKVIENFKKRK